MPGPVRLRRAARADVLALARITSAHHGGAVDDWVRRTGEQLDRGERVLLAEADGTVVAYARCGQRVPEDPDDPAPAGCWLTGAVTVPSHRRTGLARRLLGLLLAELRGSGRPVWSMTDSANEASLALHASLGFVEVLRAPRMLGQDFRSGQGVLLRLDVAAAGTARDAGSTQGADGPQEV